MAVAPHAPGGPAYEICLHKSHSMHIGRYVYHLTGKVRVATNSLKGRLTEAHPPGATMAATGIQNSTHGRRSKVRGAVSRCEIRENPGYPFRSVHSTFFRTPANGFSTTMPAIRCPAFKSSERIRSAHPRNMQVWWWPSALYRLRKNIQTILSFRAKRGISPSFHWSKPRRDSSLRSE